jgi:hypothetical protein
MRIFVFSDAKNIAKTFAKAEKTKNYSIEYHPLSDLKKTIKTPGHDSIFYLDISSFAAAEVKKQLTFLFKQKDVPFGIIDSKGVLTDVAEIFHSGELIISERTRLRKE